MAEVTKLVTNSISTGAAPPNSLPGGLKLGQAVTPGDALYIKSDGKLWKASGAALNAASRVVGFAATGRAAGKGCTPLRFVNIGGYAAGMTPGAFLYLSATVPGGLSTTPTVGGVVPVAYVVDAETIFVFGTLVDFAGIGELATLSANIPQVLADPVAGANLTAVPGSFADVAAVRTYLLTLVAEIEARLDTADTNALNIVNAGQAAGVFSAS